jgi:hypothetical protein
MSVVLAGEQRRPTMVIIAAWLAVSRVSRALCSAFLHACQAASCRPVADGTSPGNRFLSLAASQVPSVLLCVPNRVSVVSYVIFSDVT